jgi:hypothetical protein
MMPYVLRRLFATILVFYEPSDVFGLWEKHKQAMSEDYRRNNQSNFMVEQMVLVDIRKMLQSMQKDIKMYPLPDIDDPYNASSDMPREILEEATIEVDADDVDLSNTLNEEQRAAYDEIMTAVDTKKMVVCSLWMGLVAPKKLICTRPCSLLYAARIRLPWQQLHLVLQPQ